jgi:hypothetical protein
VRLAHCRHSHGGNPRRGTSRSVRTAHVTHRRTVPCAMRTLRPTNCIAIPFRRPCRSTQAQRTCAALRGRRPQGDVHGPPWPLSGSCPPRHLRILRIARAVARHRPCPRAGARVLRGAMEIAKFVRWNPLRARK